MGRKKKVSPISFEALVLEKAPTAGVPLVSFVEAEIKKADVTFRGALFRSASDQDRARHHRLRLGRLLFWLRNGCYPLGMTPDDKEVYRQIDAKRSPVVHARQERQAEWA